MIRRLAAVAVAVAVAMTLAVLSPGSATAAVPSVPTDGASARAGGFSAQARPTRGERWHRLDDRCRGGAADDPRTHDACRARDRLTHQEGIRVIEAFHAAWKRGDYARMRKLSTGNTMTMVGRSRAVADTRRDCGTFGPYYCFFKTRGGYWMGVRFEAVRVAPRRLPVWRATGAAPDAY